MAYLKSSGGGGWKPGANTLFYLNLDQSNAVFTDYKGHTTTNSGITYSASGVIDGCGYSSAIQNLVLSTFNSGESFPSQFTVMAFCKPAGSAFSNNRPMIVSLGDASNKVVYGIGLNQNNSQVQFYRLREGIAWQETYTSMSGLANARHHYAFTYDGSTYKGYIDGVLKTINSWTGSGGSSVTGGLGVFGRDNSGDPATINGYVDEVICENKVWTVQEIQYYLAGITY